MANTISASLLADTIAARVLNLLPNAVAPLNAYCTDFSNESWTDTKSIRVPRVTATSAVVDNPSSFGGGAATVGAVSITPTRMSIPFYLTVDEIAKQQKIENLAESHLRALIDACVAKANALLVAATFTITSTAVTQASFGATNAKELRGKIGKVSRKSLVLDSVAFAQLAPTDKNGFQLGENGAYGFDRIIEQTNWTSAEAKVFGFAAGPEAMAVAAGIPPLHEAIKGMMWESRIITDPKSGFSVQMNMWGSLTDRSVNCSFDVSFGAAVADANALVLVKTP